MSEPHPLDVCQCGDFRREHQDGTGRCRMPNDASHGFKTCERFRLHASAAEYQERHPDHYAQMMELIGG
jgi:hypothetical protein